MGYQVQDKYYFDLVLPNGIRSGAYICQRVTSALKFIYQQKGFDLENFLDDLGSCEVPEKAWEAYEELGQLISEVGLVESLEKACEPSTVMIFLGTGLNTETLTLFIPGDRMQELLLEIEHWHSKTTATQKEVQSLIGKLNFVTNCVHSSRIYISSLINFLKEMSPKQRYSIPRSVLLDLQFWKEFMPRYNGLSKMIKTDWTKPDQVFSCDSTLTQAAGWCEGEFFLRKFPETLDDERVKITQKECLTLVACVKLWADKCEGNKVLINCDNLSTVLAVNSGRSKNKFMQTCLREFTSVLIAVVSLGADTSNPLRTGYQIFSHEQTEMTSIGKSFKF